MSHGSQLPLGDGLAVRCECGLSFDVARSLRGGVTHCPSCGKLVQVRGIDREFIALLAIGLLAALALARLIGAAAGMTAGVVALVVALLVLGALVLAS